MSRICVDACQNIRLLIANSSKQDRTQNILRIFKDKQPENLIKFFYSGLGVL
jgi:hypothetical protein